MAGPLLAPALTEKLAADLRGTLIEPGHEEYDEARSVWNGLIDRHPALIVRCAGPDLISASPGRASRS